MTQSFSHIRHPREQAPTFSGTVLTLCGSRVPSTWIGNHPTCIRCLQERERRIKQLHEKSNLSPYIGIDKGE